MELVLDIVIILLIAVMIGYSVVLNIKLKVFRSAQNEMAALVERLDRSIARAQATVETLKNAAVREEGRLEALISKSRMLADELEIITQSGSSLADRIERGLVPAQDIQPADMDETDEDTTFEEDDEMLETLKNIR